jgi:hypothetical protein
VALNDGRGRFTLQPLPLEAQVPITFASLAADVTGDGHLDLLLAGNQYGVPPVLGRYDASRGTLLVGDGRGGFTAAPASVDHHDRRPDCGLAFVRRAAGPPLLAVARNGSTLAASVASLVHPSRRPPMTQLTTLDYVVMAIYFVVVLGIGWALRRMMRTSSDFFLSGRSLPPVGHRTGLPLRQSRRAGSHRHGRLRCQVRIATSHFYWIGAIPAMVFVGIFMMPFYYGSKARSVPEYLKLRFDEKTRTFNALGFAAMTIFSSGMSMYAMGKLLNLLLGWDFTRASWCRPSSCWPTSRSAASPARSTTKCCSSS